MARARQIQGLAGAIAAVALVFGPAPAEAQPSEQAVKAAFLPKFARYVTWPPHAQPAGSAPLVLCVIGTDSFGTLIDRAVRGQSVDQHPVAVRRMASASAAAGCHMAFVNGGSATRTSSILEALRQWPILTVTDSKLGSARGMIHFSVQDGRVRFYIDDQAAGLSNLKLDSRLLSIALGVNQRRL